MGKEGREGVGVEGGGSKASREEQREEINGTG